MSLWVTSDPKARLDARKRFLASIKQHAPEVLQKLQGDVLPVFMKFFRNGNTVDFLNRWRTFCLLVPHPGQEFVSRTCRDIEKLGDAILAPKESLFAQLIKYDPAASPLESRRKKHSSKKKSDLNSDPYQIDEPYTVAPDSDIVARRLVELRDRELEHLRLHENSLRGDLEDLANQIARGDVEDRLIRLRDFVLAWAFVSKVSHRWRFDNPQRMRALFCELHAALAAWAKEYNLTDEWLLDEAMQTLNCWQGGEREGDWAYALGEKRLEFLEQPEFRFSAQFLFRPWRTDAENWQSYKSEIEEAFKAEVKDAFKTTLKKYREWSEKHAKDKNESVAQEKREAMHFQWLVEFQINKMRVSDIAKLGYDIGQVSRTLMRLSSLIGLTRRDE